MYEEITWTLILIFKKKKIKTKDRGHSFTIMRLKALYAEIKKILCCYGICLTPYLYLPKKSLKEDTTMKLDMGICHKIYFPCHIFSPSFQKQESSSAGDIQQAANHVHAVPSGHKKNILSYFHPGYLHGKRFVSACSSCKIPRVCYKNFSN